MRRGLNAAVAALAYLLAGAVGGASAIYGGDAPRGDEGQSAAYLTWRASGGHSGSCSGVLIAPTAVLTAGHCVRSPRLGALRITGVRIGHPARGAARARVARVVVHPLFDPARPEAGHDVAVLILRAAVEGHLPARLAEAGDDPREQGTQLRILGYGVTPRGRRLSGAGTLRAAQLEYLSPFACFSGPVEEMARTRMCAASPSTGVCPGDSGAPAFRAGSEGPVLVGLVSLAIDQQTCVESAAVLTRVSAMREFITSAVAPPPPSE